jgi:hypothetical protein
VAERPQFTEDQRRELLKLGLFREQVQRLETLALLSISWRQRRAPRMQDVRDKLSELATRLTLIEKAYVRMSTSKRGACQEASARLQSAAYDLLADADKLAESLETATNIVARALELLDRGRRSTRLNTEEFVRLIYDALSGGHGEHFVKNGQPILAFLIRPSRKKKPFPDVVRIVSEASGGWSPDDAIRAYLKQRRGRLTPKAS